MIYELRKQIEYFLRNKTYMVSLIIAAVAGYGYEITHSSLGIDDVCIGLYFDDGLGVSIGRRLSDRGRPDDEPEYRRYVKCHR